MRIFVGFEHSVAAVSDITEVIGVPLLVVLTEIARRAETRSVEVNMLLVVRIRD
jgi:hypothetical protein